MLSMTWFFERLYSFKFQFSRKNIPYFNIFLENIIKTFPQKSLISAYRFFLKSLNNQIYPDIAVSLNYRLVLAGSLGALGRRFESCRPDQL